MEIKIILHLFFSTVFLLHLLNTTVAWGTCATLVCALSVAVK